MTSRPVLSAQPLLSEPERQVEVPAIALARAAAILGALVRGGQSVEALLDAAPELSGALLQRRLALFSRVLEERAKRGQPLTLDDELARRFGDLLMLHLAERAMTTALEADGDELLEEARDRVDRHLDRVERRFFEAAVPLLVEGAEPGGFILRVDPRREFSEVHLVDEALRGVRTLVTDDPDLRVRRLTGFESVEALSKHITQTEEALGLVGVQVILDTGCNQRCVHCFLGEKRPLQDLDGVERLLEDELPRAGLRPRLYFSEPFTKAFRRRGQGLERLVSLLARHQPNLVLTNGLEVDDEVLDALERQGPFRVYVGLLGASPKTHERITRLPGSFERALETLRCLGDRGITLGLNLMVYRDNLAELPQMIELAANRGVVSVFLSTLYTVPGSPPGLAELCLDGAGRRELITALGRLRQQFRRGPHLEIGAALGINFHTRGIYQYLGEGLPYCTAGRTTVALHPTTGKIYPCMKLTAPQFEIGHWDAEAGRPVIDARRNPLARLSRDVGALKGVCSPSRCAWAPICRGGCRAMAAFASGGDLLAGQPFCLTRLLDE